jgi:hypothetical protein
MPTELDFSPNFISQARIQILRLRQRPGASKPVRETLILPLAVVHSELRENNG